VEWQEAVIYQILHYEGQQRLLFLAATSGLWERTILKVRHVLREIRRNTSTFFIWILHAPLQQHFNTSFHPFIPVACAECDNSLPFSGAFSITLCYVLFPATLLHQPFFHPLSPHLAISFLVYLSILLFSNSYLIPFWEFYFLPFPVHAQTNIIYLTLLSLL